MRALAILLLLSGAAWARPPGPATLCATWPEAQVCQQGLPDCAVCHTAPPPRNVFGQAIEAKLLPGTPRPLTDAQYAEALPGALAAVADADADGDGVANRDELRAGTDAADPLDFPGEVVAGCRGPSINPRWDVCGYDPVYAYKRVTLDFCGHSPSYEALQAVREATPEAQRAQVLVALEACLDSPFWVGRDGVLWQLAHQKIRPLLAIKSGRNSGPVPLADYDNDYALFTYTQTDDRDAREVLTAQYYVAFDGETGYQELRQLAGESVTEARRAGMLTTKWYLTINTMFTALPRTSAAQAYRSYLGLDIARSEGLFPVAGEPLDYDDKGVTQPTCAGCHSTLDPLAYPFALYHGIDGARGTYNPARIRQGFRNEGPDILDMPEAGVIFGRRVADLVEWAEVAANSEAFAQATVADYWRLLVGHPPTGAEEAEFDQLWRDLRGRHGYRVERMLRALVQTEAYGAP